MSHRHTVIQRRPRRGTFLTRDCRDMQRRFHRASESIFVAPSALPIREVISAAMEPSAQTIEPRYVNEDTIRLVLEINMVLVSVRLIHIPTLITSLHRVGVQNTGVQKRPIRAISSA